MVKTNFLAITWATSRGRDTYGYRICRLDDRNANTRFKTTGGGYDMIGTVLGDWLQSNYQARYSKAGGYVAGDALSSETLYGACHHVDEDRVTLDGACGVESMLRVAEAIGISASRTWDRKGHTTGFMVTEYESGAELAAARG